MHEIEVKVLDVDKSVIEQKLRSLSAEKVSEEKLIVDWYGPQGLTHDGDDPWFLRVRTYFSSKKYEVTWKAKSELFDVARKHKEINFTVSDTVMIEDLFGELGLEKYAHQEKERLSWKYKDFQFDLDTYPGMPSFLEIEAKNESELIRMIRELGLENHQTWNDGERTLIKNKYNLNWFEMYF